MASHKGRKGALPAHGGKRRPGLGTRQVAEVVLCHAKSKRTHERCKQRAVPGMKVCRFHGGNTPRGINSPHFKHGKYSKHLPEKIRTRYQTALDDPELMSLKHDIAVTESRITELLERIDSGEAGKVWKQLKVAGEQFDSAYQSGNSDKLLKSVQRIRELVTTGAQEYDTFKEIQEVQEHRRKMTETENKMLIAKQQMVSVEQVMTLMALILEVIQRHAVVHIVNRENQQKFLKGVGEDFGRLSVIETI